jgi:hypothetical protein
MGPPMRTSLTVLPAVSMAEHEPSTAPVTSNAITRDMAACVARWPGVVVTRSERLKGG